MAKDSTTAPDKHVAKTITQIAWNALKSSEIRRDVILIVIILLIKVGLEHANVGFIQLLDNFGNSVLQEMMSWKHRKAEPEVLVVDISALGRYDADTGKYTDRDLLLEAIKVVAGTHPRGIGVDVDFSPKEGGEKEPLHAREFLDSMLDLSKTDNVALGVYRKRFDGEAEWLGNIKYKSLAASTDLALFEPESKYPDNTLVPLMEWTFPMGNPEKPIVGTFIPSLGEKLGSFPYRNHKAPATAAPSIINRPSPWLTQLSQVTSDQSTDHECAGYEFFTLNLAPLDRLKDNYVKVCDANSLQSMVKQDPQLFTNKTVLFGYVSDASIKDSFSVLGFIDPVPGVMLHACAAYTRSQHFVYRVTPFPRIAFDLVLSLFVLIATTVFSEHRHKRRAKYDHGTMHSRVTTRAAFAIFIIGFALAYIYSILWTDFVWVALTLFLHDAIGVEIKSAWEGILKRTPISVQKMFSYHAS